MIGNPIKNNKRNANTMKKTKSLILFFVTLLIAGSIFSQNVALEPVGRYLYQTGSGTDHLLNATGISGGRILVAANPKMALIDFNQLPITGTQSYITRAAGGGRDVLVYQDTYIYVNKHQSVNGPNSWGFGISKITGDSISPVKTIKEDSVFFEKMTISGSHLFCAAHSDGIRIYSLQDPENPTLTGTLSTGFTDAFDVAVSSDTLFVADGAGGLKIVDISNISNPQIITGETIASALGTAQAVETRNGRTYVASSGAGLCVYLNGDLQSRQVYPLKNCAEDMVWVGDYLAVSTMSGFSVFEIGTGTNVQEVGSEKTGRYNSTAKIRTSFGIGALGDSIVLVSCWTTVDCYKIRPMASSSIPDITSSTQRIRFPAAGGSKAISIVNNGGGCLTISSISFQSSSPDFSTNLLPQTIAPGDSISFQITYTAGPESNGSDILMINSDDPDEGMLPIQVIGNTSHLDPGEAVPDFTLPTIYTDPQTGIYSEGQFKLSDHLGKVIWIQVFGTWCPACPSAEIDMQNTIIKEFEGNPNVVTYVLDQADKVIETKEWVTFWGTKFYQRKPMLYDEGGLIGLGTFSQPNIGNMPFGRGMIIDQYGNVAMSYFGHQPGMVIETIYSLLSQNSVEKENTISDDIQVFPNPATETCTVELHSFYSSIEIGIYTILGTKIDNLIWINTDKIELDFSDLASGIYLLSISADNNYSTLKIIRQ